MPPLLLALLAVLLGCTTAQVAPAGEGGAWDDGRVVRVCAAARTPLVFCHEDGGLLSHLFERQGLDNLSGFQVDLFHTAAALLGLPRSQIELVCLPGGQAEVVAELLAGVNGSRCDVALDVDVDVALIDEGVTYTHITLTDGHTIIVPAATSSPSIWSFLYAFDLTLWLAILGSILLTALTTWLIEVVSQEQGAEVAPLSEMAWNAILKSVAAGVPKATTSPAKLMVLTYSLLLVVMMSLYTSKTAALLTAKQLRTNIRSYVDLPGRTVVAPKQYVQQLRLRGIQATGFEWANDGDLEQLLDVIRSGDADALVLRSSIAGWVDATNCDVTVVGGDFLMGDIAMAFPVGFDSAPLLSGMNRMLAWLRTNGVTENLETRWITPASSDCSITANKSSLTFDQVAGLWVMLGGMTLLAVLMAGSIRLKRWLVRNKGWAERSEAYMRRLGRRAKRARNVLVDRSATMAEKQKGAGAAAAAAADAGGPLEATAFTSRQLDALEPILHGAMVRILQQLDDEKAQRQRGESPAPSTPTPEPQQQGQGGSGSEVEEAAVLPPEKDLERALK